MQFFLKSLIVACVSITLMWGISLLNPNKWISKLGFSLFFVFFLLMFLMNFFSEDMVTQAGGARRWIRFPGFSISPVEFFKIGFVFFLAWSFSRKIGIKKITLIEEAKLLGPHLFMLFVIAILIAIMQNDLGQVVLMGSVFGILAIFAGSSFRFFLILLIVAMIIVATLIIFSDHRVIRVLQWWSSTQNFVLSYFPDFIANNLRVDNIPPPYQIGHSLNAIHNGGVFGHMLGYGEFKYGFLTEVHTDFVLSGIAEEIGLIGIFAICLLMLSIIYQILKVANRVKNKTYYLFCVGIALLLGIAFIINSFGISGIIPIKGLAVPFLSYGGSSTLALSIAIGMVLSISKKSI
jgi:cell division protein FtsW